MIDLLRIRIMLGYFASCPYNGPDWDIYQNTQKINCSHFNSYLFLKVYFLEDWRYEILRVFLPSIHAKIHTEHYQKICRGRKAKISRLIKRCEEIGLIKLTHLNPYSSYSPEIDTEITLTLKGVNFRDNFTDFLKVMFDEYGYLGAIFRL